jgi:hypothetical protein
MFVKPLQVIYLYNFRLAALSYVSQENQPEQVVTAIGLTLSENR